MHIMKQIFNEFEDNDISYLHFKSNTNLELSFLGKADFDVLVDRLRISDIEAILLANCGKRHNPQRFGQYPCVDNWLIFDACSGIIYHLHLHYQIATGKTLLKEYTIPWSDLLFKTRVKDNKFQIFITDPSLELILLSVRSVLKSRFADWFKARIGTYKLHKSLNNERRDIQSKVDWETTEKYLSILFEKKYVSELLRLMKTEDICSRDFRKLTKIIRKSMKYQRRFSPLKSNFLSSYYRFRDLLNKFNSRKMEKCPIIKKTSLGGGLIIAFVGVDGAGKSTMTKEIASWISKKIECKRFYMGTGDGKTSVFVSTMKRANKVAGERGVNAGKDGKVLRFINNPFGFMRKLAKLFVVCDVEKNNSKKISKMQQYKLNGGISLLDRYPQIEVEGQNDGPKVCNYERIFGNTWYIRRMKKKEKESMSIVKYVIPDLVFRLNISAETSMARKPEQKDIEMFKQKIIDLNRINFQGATIIDIDAEQPYSDELLEIKSILWRYI